MEEYKSNSHKSKIESKESISEKKVEKIIEGTAKQKKKNKIQGLADIFISDDVGNVKSYIFLDVLIPTIKKALSDIVKNGIDMILYGGTDRNKKNSTASKVSYRGYYEKENDRRDYGYDRPKNGYSYDDVVLDSRGEAEDVLSRMDELISTYGLVSVADLYDLVGLPDKYTDNKYGWTDIHNAHIVQVRDGHMLKMPKALPLD